MGSRPSTHGSPASASLSRRAQRYQQRRSRVRKQVLAVVGGVVLAFGIVVVVVAAAGGGTKATPPYTGSTVELVLGDYTITGNLTAPAGPVRLHAVNRGGLVHNFGLRGLPIGPDLQPGRDGMLDAGVLKPGTYQLYCDLAGHVDKGMVANLVITDPLPGTTTAATG